MTARRQNRGPGLSRIRSVTGGLVLSGSVSLERVAGRLGTSPRTVQRRLREHGLCFRDIVEGSRLEIAGALLRETNLSIQEISCRLGYAAPNAFTRAFARWNGLTPRAYRRASNK